MRLAFPILLGVTAVALGVTSARLLADENLSIVVDPRTGAASLRNDSTAPLAIDGYLLRASAPTFSPPGWSSLEGVVAGFRETAAGNNRLGELNLTGSTSLNPGQSLSLGSPYAPFAPTEFGAFEPAFDFTYSLASGGSFTGDVEFSRRNTVVLVVDPATGAASLQNQSAFNIQLDGYLLTSATGKLDTAGWQSLQTSLGVSGGWRSGTGASNRLAEGNLLGSTALSANGGSLSLGFPVNEALLTDETDLSLEFTIVGGGSLQGAVLFRAATTVLTGDYNLNGAVDAADYSVWRDTLGLTTNLVADGSGNGVVDVADYNLWKTNFGASGPAAAVAQSAAVPEPTGVIVAVLLAVGTIATKATVISAGQKR